MAPLTLTAQHHSYHSHGVTLGSGRKGDSTGERGDRLEPLSRTLPANVGANRDHDPRARLCCLSRPAVSRDQASGCELKKRGARLLSMSVLYGDQRIEHRLRDSGAKVLVTDSANRARVPEGLAAMVFVIDSPEARAERSPGDFDLMAELGRASDAYEPADTAAEDPAQLYYSSGTTGLAKGILHAHRYLLAHEEFEFCHDVQDGELFHGMGEWAWAAGICPLLGPWRYGATQLVYARRGGFDPDEQLHFLSKHGAENIFTTPTALRSMTGISDAAERYPLKRLRIACSAGEPLNPEVIRWFREQYEVTVLDYYGLTESYPVRELPNGACA